MKHFTRILCIVLCIAMVGGVTTFAAGCDPDYTVTYKDGTKEMGTEKVKKDGYATASGIDTDKDNYTFDGWYAESSFTTLVTLSETAITSSRTLYAKYTYVEPLVYYTVIFYNGGAEFDRNAAALSGSKIAPPSATPVSGVLNFIGWFTTIETTGIRFDFNTSTVTANISLYAKFTDETVYTVSFDNLEGATMYDMNFVAGEIPTRPADPERTGYLLDEWLYNGETYEFNTELTGNITLSAKWVAAFTVTFNSNGGTAVSTQTIAQGGTATAPTNPSRVNYSFAGWMTTNNGAIAYNFNTAVTGNITLYASWTESIEGDGTLVFSIGELDGVFSPYYSTSAYDGEIVGMTQISMIQSNEEGQAYMGEDVPTVALDYTEKTYVNGDLDDDAGSLASQLTDNQKKDGNLYWTEYEFAIKNGMKFSDGTDLTINDVIYNMYVYLDPMYTGSSTMYSTAIKGLNAYREQNPELTDGTETSFQETFTNLARKRLTNISSYFAVDSTNRDSYRASVRKNDTEKGTEIEMQIISDVEWIRERFWQELQSDWNSIVVGFDKANYTSYQTEGTSDFTEGWEAFLLSYNMITVTYETDGTIQVDDDGFKKINYNGSKKWYHDKDNLIKIVFDNYFGIYDDTEKGNFIDTDEAREKYADGYKKPRVDLEFNNDGDVTGSSFDLGTTGHILQGEASSGTLHTTLAGRFVNAGTGTSILGNIRYIAYYETGADAITTWSNNEMSAYFREIETSGKKAVSSISGITVRTATSFVGKVHGNNVIKTGESNYILKISIVGVDPKAKWNFAFTVSPMSYYSNPVGKDTSFTASDGYSSFNYPGTIGYDSSQDIHVGFKTHDTDYVKDVFRESSVLKLPVGGGAFMASDTTGSTKPDYTNFYNNNMVYYKRNPYFYTTGEQMQNTRFETLRYQVISDTSKTMEMLAQGAIHYASPGATAENINLATLDSKLTPVRAENNGYGYVGVNAKYVHDIKIRQAIMHAMDTSLILNYYTGGLASLIYRPMSKASWAYPTDATDRYPYTSYAAALKKVKELITSAGYLQKRDGVLAKRIEDSGSWDVLEFTFTIAGAETDHPAYEMFVNAAKILNEAGMKITVYPDARALSKLSAGLLSVWAAAWGSTIDPDMYQVYHKDSQAQSVNNWGYPYLIKEKNGTAEEITIITTLSKLIVEARSTNDENFRKIKYKAALNQVMELAVEYPTYQRQNLFVYNHSVIKSSTIRQNPTAYAGMLDRIWEVELY